MNCPSNVLEVMIIQNVLSVGGDNGALPIPPGLNHPGATSTRNEEVTVQVLEALDEHTVRLVFTVPTVLIGLRGRVELKYTNDLT